MLVHPPDTYNAQATTGDNRKALTNGLNALHAANALKIPLATIPAQYATTTTLGRTGSVTPLGRRFAVDDSAVQVAPSLTVSYSIRPLIGEY